MGVSYLQIDASVQPGSSGGPLLDDQGRAVGIVSMMVGSTSGLGLALPVNYLVEGPDALLDSVAVEINRERWQARLSAAAGADRREIADLETEMRRPAVVGAFLEPPGAVVAIVVRWGSSPPGHERITFSLHGAGGSLCEPAGEVASWHRLTDRFRQETGSRYLMWLERNGLMREMYAGPVHLQMRGCPNPSAVVGATLKLEGGCRHADRVRVESRSRDITGVRHRARG